MAPLRGSRLLRSTIVSTLVALTPLDLEIAMSYNAGLFATPATSRPLATTDAPSVHSGHGRTTYTWPTDQSDWGPE